MESIWCPYRMSSSFSLAKRQDCGAACGGPLFGSSERAVAKVLREELVLDALKDVDRIVVAAAAAAAAIAIHMLEEGGKVGQAAALARDGRGMAGGAWFVVQAACKCQHRVWKGGAVRSR